METSTSATDVREIELLAPARDIAVAKEAVLHGADAVYIGPPGFGARSSAANSIDDIKRLVEFAHPFRVRIYATVNTIVKENEIRQAESMIHDLYRAGVDALIVQDMGILRMDIPPIALHASTQCHINSPEKALFLQNAGFSQLVLARELSVSEIERIHRSVNVPLEVFVHGALCVSYSGRCHASQHCFSRSANRGECAQICRLPFTLTDASGRVISSGRHLLSLKDFNQLSLIPDLLAAGASSFKIEGRLKDASYVKNTVAAYRAAIDRAIAAAPDRYRRKSYGCSEISFTPDLLKSFNRGFTHYFSSGKADGKIASILTPKSVGEPIDDISLLNNGDGIAFFDRKNGYTGLNVNRVDGGRILNMRNISIPRGTQIYRTRDIKWESMLSHDTATRKIPVDISLDSTGVTATDSRGVTVRVALGFKPLKKESGTRVSDFRTPFSKLGNTIYSLRSFTSLISSDMFVPASVLTNVRRKLTETLDNAAAATYRFDIRNAENRFFPYISRKLSYKDNVSNSLAKLFYKDHQTETSESALEISSSALPCGSAVMTTKYCILHELGLCRKKEKPSFQEPLRISSGKIRFRLHFDCARCGMELLTD